MKRRAPLSRRGFIRAGLGALGAAACGNSSPPPTQTRQSALPTAPICYPTRRPNILFISIDDLNDFASPLGGYPGVQTPNMDRLAAQGVTFERAYCAVPSCGGSRSATLTGIAPYRSALYSQENILDLKSQVLGRVPYSDFWSLPRYFKQQGYRMLGGGKVYHAGYSSKGEYGNYESSVWEDYFRIDFNDTSPDYRSPVPNDGRLQTMIGRNYDTPQQEALMPDKALAAWAAGHLGQTTATDDPFFMAVGFYRPHISWRVPSRFYDQYPLDKIQVPNFFAEETDVTDLPPFAKRYMVETHWATNELAPPPNDEPSRTDHYDLDEMPFVDGRGGHAQAIQAYLASTSLADECLGQVLDALESSAVADNTIIVLWSDHGWFLGEKLGWRKFKLWERSARVPVIVSAPGGTQGARTRAVTSLLDLYPTLVDLAFDGQGPVPPQELDGQSLRPVLEEPDRAWPSGAITSYRVDLADAGPDPVVHSLRTDRWRYVSYPKETGGLFEELYDLAADPQERDNLLYSDWDAHQRVRRTLRKLLLSRAPVTEVI